MKIVKKGISGILAILLCISAIGCGKNEQSQKTTTTEFTGNEKIKVTTPAPAGENAPDTITLTGIPDGAEKEIEWLSYFDINPAKGSAEKRADLQLFEAYGGSIEYIRTTSLTKFDKLAELVLTGDNPDMFWFEQKMVFPCNVVQGMFQPIDSIVDFDNPLWVGVKDYAENFSINEKHYVAPISFEVQSVLTYDQKNIANYGLDDPYQLYLEGEWNWNSFEKVMRDWVALGDDEDVYYGVNGWLHPHIFHTTGKSIIEYDKQNQEYYSNIDDADLDRAATFLYGLSKDNLISTEWMGAANEAFTENCLFYAMGVWASIDTHTPSQDDDWRVVPIPKDPESDEYYMSVSPIAYMWVKGSDKADAMKCWLECARIVCIQDEYKQAQKEKFYLNNPYYNEDAYNLVYDELISDEFVRVYDAGYGISTDISNDDAASNDTKEAIISYLYSSVSKIDAESGGQYTWSKLRSTYEGVIDSELKTFNAVFKDFIANN